MSEDLNDKVKQIAEMLNKEGMQENLKNIINAFTSSSGKENPNGEKRAQSENNSGMPGSDMIENMEMMQRIKGVMDRLGSRSDPRVNLLQSVRPFLNEKRQKKLKNCIMLLQFSAVAKLLDEKEKE